MSEVTASNILPGTAQTPSVRVCEGNLTDSSVSISVARTKFGSSRTSDRIGSGDRSIARTTVASAARKGFASYGKKHLLAVPQFDCNRP